MHVELKLYTCFGYNADMWHSQYSPEPEVAKVKLVLKPLLIARLEWNHTAPRTIAKLGIIRAWRSRCRSN